MLSAGRFASHCNIYTEPILNLIINTHYNKQIQNQLSGRSKGFTVAYSVCGPF